MLEESNTCIYIHIYIYICIYKAEKPSVYLTVLSLWALIKMALLEMKAVFEEHKVYFYKL